MTDNEILELLRKIDDGYVPTMKERENLSMIRSLFCVGIEAIPVSIKLLSSLLELRMYGDNQNSVWIKYIPESLGLLNNLTVLDLHDNRITRLPDNLGCLTNLKVLNLSGNRIQNVPDSIGNLSMIKELDLSDNQISELPESITFLSLVERIDLSDNHISVLPDGIGTLTKIKGLYLNNNGITSLPDSICSLNRLCILELSGCPLKTVPESVGMIKNLLTLDLDNTQISELPESIGELGTLQSIRLSNSPIRMIPEAIGKLRNLKYLDLSNSNINRLPESLGYLFNLETLELRNSQINELPQSIGNLKKLSELNLCNVPISELPESICALINIECFDFSSSQIKILPERLGELTNLRRLDLSNTPIKQLPRSIGRLLNLEELNLSKTQINELPEEMRLLNRLIKLDISCTRIQDISVLSHITSLMYLDMWETKVYDISCLQRLQGLNTLNISVTQVNDISSLAGLQSLTSLDISGTKVSDISAIQDLPSLSELKMAWVPVKDISALQGLSNLTELNLFETPVNDISALSKSKSLNILNISRTNLGYIPEFLLDLNLDFINEEMGEGDGIYIKDIMLMNDPVEVFYQSRNIITEYLRNRDDKSKVIVGECKVVFLGDGGSGKSTSIERILLDGEKINHEVYRTMEGNVNRKSVSIGFDNIDMYIWDFGGQTIQNALHRLFMTQRSLYIICIDSRNGRLDDQAEYWLREVITYAYGSPVLLVVNKADLNPHAYINEFKLKELYPYIKKVITISALYDSKETFNSTLIGGIIQCMSEMDSIYLKIPKSWKSVLMELRELQRQYIKMEEYKLICKNCGISNFEEISQPLLDWIVDLGIGFYISNNHELNQYLVLQPTWLMNAIGTIVSSKDLSRNGFIQKAYIYKAFIDGINVRGYKDIGRQYSEVEVSYILDVLHQFEISFEVTGETEFFPMFCDINENVKFSDIVGKDYLHHVYRYNYLPDNVVHRLIVKMQHDLDYKYVWYHGAVFRNKNDGFVAYVNASSNQIDVYVGTMSEMLPSSEYMYLLRSKISQINQDMNIVSEEYVCYRENDVEEEFSYKILIGTKKNGITSLYSEKLNKVIPVDEILTFANKANTNIVNDIVESLKALQANPYYYNAKEDSSNMYVRDLLEAKGYYCKDPTIRYSEKRTVETDIYIMDPRTGGEYFFEGLVTSFVNKSLLIRHIQKLLMLCNVNMKAEMFLVSYIKGEREQFERISNRVFELLSQERIEIDNESFIPYKCEEVNLDNWGLACKKITYLNDTIPYNVHCFNLHIASK